MTPITLGDHMFVSRVGYTHHGIYIGDGCVVHYSGLANGLNKGAIQETSIDDFALDGKVSIRKYRNPVYTGEAAVQRALERIGEDLYDLHANNCEHFCTWVIMGVSKSSQVDFVEDCLDIVIPRAIVNVARARKHLKQNSNSQEIFKDVAESVVLTAAATVVAGPVVLAYKVGKWIFGRDS